eukprot:366289-Chlamydomonas_euryale.AAC.8
MYLPSPLPHTPTSLVHPFLSHTSRLVQAAKAAPKASTDTAPSKLSRHQMRLDPAQLVRQLDISVDLKQLSQPVPNLLVTRLLGRRWAPAAAAARPATETGVLSIADWKARAVVDMQAQPRSREGVLSVAARKARTLVDMQAQLRGRAELRGLEGAHAGRHAGAAARPC